jgi:hypothetical protein
MKISVICSRERSNMIEKGKYEEYPKDEEK